MQIKFFFTILRHLSSIFFSSRLDLGYKLDQKVMLRNDSDKTLESGYFE